MKKFPKQLAAIFQKLGLSNKAQKKELSANDWKAIRKAYKKEYGSELDADQKAYEASVNQAKKQQQRAHKVEQDNAAALKIAQDALRRNGRNRSQKNGGAQNQNVPQTLSGAVQTLATIAENMTKQTLPDNPQSVGGNSLTLPINGPDARNDRYFGGMPHSMFSMERRWNQIARNPKLALTDPVDEKKHGATFREHFQRYSEKVSKRINFHKENKSLNVKALTSPIDISLNGNAGLGDQYVIIREDALIARLLMVKDVYDIFPRMFGVQDREVMTNAFFGDFSQAYQEGQVFKGSIELEPEIAYVDDSMMKTYFKSMKELERQYIGYLNQEGSDPIKWSMIEWALLNISTKLILEQNERKILGIYMKPAKDEPGHFLNAGTGVLYTMLRYYNEGKMALVDDPAFSNYTSGSTMVGVVTEMALLLGGKVDGFNTQYEVILNENHRPMWLKGIREIYGKDTDFTGPDGDRIPDTTILIRWCPYWGTLPIVLFQIAGNIRSVEFEPGEMHKYGFETGMERVFIWSTWKEGTAASYVGRPFPSKAECKANDFKEQQIFMNKPALMVAADAEVLTAEGDHRVFVTGENTGAKAITDIAGAKPGFAYMIEVGDEANPQTIAKAGKFSEITAAYNPTKLGDYIIVGARDKDVTKFYELERCEGGVRKINKDLQPNVPGPGGR